MTALIISDIHSNFEALVAVAKAHEYDQVWCAGDLVDFGPEPAEVVQWVRHHSKHVVRGNHDHALVCRTDCGSSPELHALSVASREMNRPLLTVGQMEFLGDLPSIKDFVVNGLRFHIAHADPRGDLYRFDLVPEASYELLVKATEDIDADVIICGHTHRPMVRRIGSKLFVNPGSVGLQFDGDPRASYAVWHNGKVKLHRTEYDYEATVLRLAESTLPISAKAQMIDLIREGRIGVNAS